MITLVVDRSTRGTPSKSRGGASVVVVVVVVDVVVVVVVVVVGAVVDDDASEARTGGAEEDESLLHPLRATTVNAAMTNHFRALTSMSLTDLSPKRWDLYS